MSDETPVLFERHGEQIAILTFNRPEKMNALSTALLHQLNDLLHQIERDPVLRVVILTGAGEKAFVAGADIGEYAGQDYAQFVAYQQYAHVHGHAGAGGSEIALCCDVLIASTNARLGLPEGLLGLSPGGGGTQRLTRAVGRYVAADVLLSARRLSAERAYELGLVAEVTDPGELMEAAIKKAEYMLKVAPLSARAMKRLIREGVDGPLETGLSLEQEVLFRLYMTDDAQEGIRAFVEKRDANFRGT